MKLNKRRLSQDVDKHFLDSKGKDWDQDWDQDEDQDEDQDQDQDKDQAK